jgi:hypothetical protein
MVDVSQRLRKKHYLACDEPKIDIAQAGNGREEILQVPSLGHCLEGSHQEMPEDFPKTVFS